MSVALELDDQNRLGRLIDPGMEPRVGITCQAEQPPVVKVADRGLQLRSQAMLGAEGGIRQPGEREHHNPLSRRQGDGPQNRLQHQCQRTLGTAHQPGQVDSLRARGPTERIAGTVAWHGGHQLGQPLLALPINVLQLANDQVRERGRLLVIGGPRLEPKIGDLSLGHDHAKLFDLVAHGTEPQRPDPGRIDADHTPHGADPGIDGNRFQPATQGS